jgi:hypothetical protein
VDFRVLFPVLAVEQIRIQMRETVPLWKIGIY